MTNLHGQCCAGVKYRGREEFALQWLWQASQEVCQRSVRLLRLKCLALKAHKLDTYAIHLDCSGRSHQAYSQCVQETGDKLIISSELGALGAPCHGLLVPHKF